MEYTERYCGFVDVLGFSDLVDRLAERPTEFSFLRDILSTIHTPFPDACLYHSRFPGSDFKSHSISDAVAVSTAVNRAGLLHIFASLAQLAGDLLLKGYFTRGAIVKGRLYHDRTMVFGEAFIEALRLERDVVKYPRIMATPGIVRLNRLEPGRCIP